MEASAVYQEWLQNPLINEGDRTYLESIKEEETLIEELFYRNLVFGTAGMRGIIGIGTNRINIYQVAKATQAYANALSQLGFNKKGIVIAYDTRNFSKEFAEEAARVLLQNDIKVYLFDDICSVPELSFAVRHLDTDGGIVITASHNPKEYNGYKIYSSYGGQLVPGDMEPIIKAFNKIESFSSIRIYSGELYDHPLMVSIGKEVHEAYYKALLKTSISDDINKNIRIVYSPIHGTGMRCVPEILKRRGFVNIDIVQEQNLPDISFSTVKVPNPENEETLTMAVNLAKKKDADLVLATDPDCDRVGIAVKDEQGRYTLLNGNQIGALLIDYIVHAGQLPENAVMIQTVVTSGLGKNIAEAGGVEVLEVLTGFKYIGEKMTEFEQKKNKNFILGYEESYGYLSGNHARDKDAANACMLLAEMAGYYQLRGSSIYQRLTQIYHQHGYYNEKLHNITFDGIDGMNKMGKILDMLRANPFSTIDNEPVSVTDYMYDETGLPKENVLKYNMESGSWVALRPSGTEPKFKIYFSAVAETQSLSIEKCNRMLEQIVKEIEN
ncbi:MAG: phospho-sugar mutase [Clostridia bacterium]|nr:phospho-sugar mutase [Clostridia bacterium]